MTRFTYYLNYFICLVVTLIAFELCWIGAKYVIEGEVVHTYLDPLHRRVRRLVSHPRHYAPLAEALQGPAEQAAALRRTAMRKDIPLHQYPKDVQIAALMIGLNYKRPYIRHGPAILQAIPRLLLLGAVRARL